jgi:hypothetical protein
MGLTKLKILTIRDMANTTGKKFGGRKRVQKKKS